MEEQVVNQGMSVWVPVIAALGSSFLTGSVAVLINYLNKKAELEKVKTQAMITAGIESWKTVIEAHKGKAFTIPPMDSYILHMYKFSDVLFDSNTNEENIVQRLEEVTKFIKEANKHWDNT